MGFVPSATTLTATAYLTDRGRELLFNKGNIRYTAAGVDLFQVTQFALSDQDTNYLTGARLTTGEIPDASGESEGCLKTSANLTQQNLIFFDVDGITAGGADPLSENPNYRADVLNATILADGTVRDTININTLPTV